MQPYLKLYIAILEDAPSNMVPVLVAHSMLGAHLDYMDAEKWPDNLRYTNWLWNSFRKVTLKVSQEEFDKIRQLHPNVYVGHENKTLEGKDSCAIPLPYWSDMVPSVLSYAKLWRP